MCGFAGVIAWDEKYRIDRATLQRMSACIAHRGPDGEGIYLDDQHEITPQSPLVGMAFRRLAIIDLDERSNQPFISTDKRYVMCFNGEIYNYRELRAEISKHLPDYHWRSAGDTETLLMSYVLWKEKCVEHLNGMFAIAIWDHQEKSLYLARDRMGQKPLYYSYEFQQPIGVPKGDANFGHAKRMIFGSELLALQLTPSVHLPTFLARGYVDSTCGTQTTRQLPPGSWLRVNEDDGKSNRYFLPSRNNARETTAVDAVRSTQELLSKAVQRQLVADVPVGCFLSGGIDSSVIALLMRKLLPAEQPLHTFSIRFDDPRFDESEYASAVARHLKTEHHTFEVTPKVAADLVSLVKVFGEPFADSSALPVMYLSRETRKYVKVVLSGDGGDELFGGYDRYSAMNKSAFLDSPLGVISSKLVAIFPASNHPKSNSARLKRFFATAGLGPAQRYQKIMAFFSPTVIGELLGTSAFVDRALFELFATYLVGRDPVTASLAVDRETYLPDDLLTKTDRCSMLHGLEVRSPFMDHELVQFAAGLTTDQLLKGGKKRMLREAFAADLPDFVFKRKKMGFAVPIGEWFRGELRSMLRDHLFASDGFCRQHFNMKVVERLVEEHEQERVDHSQRLYALLMLEMWWIHVVRSPSSPLPPGEG